MRIFFHAAWQKQEGDITYLTDKFLLPEKPDDPFYTLSNGHHSKRAAIKNRYRLWVNGTVPYVISSSYTGNVAWEKCGYTVRWIIYFFPIHRERTDGYHKGNGSLGE